MLLHWVGSKMYKDTEEGFKLMNSALKQRVEAGSQSDQILKHGVATRVTGDGLTDM